MQELVKQIYACKKEKEAKDERIATLKAESDELDKKITELSKSLLEAMKTTNTKELAVDNIKAGWFSRENIGYRDEKEVIAWLKQNCQSDYIKIKTTESIDKTALKKAMKLNEDLAKDLENFVEKSVTEYAVVTSADNYQAMLEHMGK